MTTSDDTLTEDTNIKKIPTIYGIFYSWEVDLITQQLEQYSAHTRNELSMLRAFINNGDNIIDIGSHIGTFAIPFAKFNNSDGIIFAFEANINNYNLLLKNIEMNCLQNIIIPIHAVIWSEDRQQFNANLPDNGNSGMYYFTATDNENINAVQSLSIDNWYKNLTDQSKINLIKIDVEGAELFVLQSLKNLIIDQLPILYIEINNTALARFNTFIEQIEIFLNYFGYHYFYNTGQRNSNNDNYRIARLKHIHYGGNFFDVLAIHPQNDNYAKNKLISVKHYRIN